MSKPNPSKIVERIVSHDWRRLGKSIASVVLVGLPMGLVGSSDSEAALSYSAQTSIEEASQSQVSQGPVSLSLRARNTLRSLASNIASLPTRVVGEAPLNWQQWVHPVSSTTDTAGLDLSLALAQSDLSWALPNYASLPVSDSVSDVELSSYQFDFMGGGAYSGSLAKSDAVASGQRAAAGRPVLSIRTAVRIALGILHQTDIADRHSPKAWFHLGQEPLVDASGADGLSALSVLFVSERPEHPDSAIAHNSERDHASIASAQAVSWANLEQQPVFAFGRPIDPSRYQHNTLS